MWNAELHVHFRFPVGWFVFLGFGSQFRIGAICCELQGHSHRFHGATGG